MVAHLSSFCRVSFIPKFQGVPPPRAEALNAGGVGEIVDFRPLSRHISETVQDRTNIAIDH